MKPRLIQVVDLGFGDSGKGTIVDYLAHKHGAQWIVRFNGGPQAGHNVVLPDGRHHTFAQFGSASFEPHVRTLLSRFMLIDPYAMLNEAAHLHDLGVANVFSRTYIDQRCLVIMPPQQIANRVRERARGDAAHGTCGMGVGECVFDAIQHPQEALCAADLFDAPAIRKKLLASFLRKRSETAPMMGCANELERNVLRDPAWIDTAMLVYRQIAEKTNIIPASQADQILRESPCTIFEGAQGVLLDERFGFHPHTTWSKTTFTNADLLLEEAESEAACFRLGVMRPYLTRHGNGPLVSEDRELGQRLCDPHNRHDGWPGRFRYGLLDLVMLRYAIQICGRVDGLAVTCLDHLPHLPPLACEQYKSRGGDLIPGPSDDLDEMDQLTRRLKRATAELRPWPTQSADVFIAALESELAVPVAYRSHGPTRDDKQEIVPP